MEWGGKDRTPWSRCSETGSLGHVGAEMQHFLTLILKSLCNHYRGQTEGDKGQRNKKGDQMPSLSSLLLSAILGSFWRDLERDCGG